MRSAARTTGRRRIRGGFATPESARRQNLSTWEWPPPPRCARHLPRKTGEDFWGLILPHGLLELTAVFVAGGVGLRLFWSWIEPGQLSRSQSLAREGRTAGTVALGLVAVLFVSGAIEAFVTPSGLPTWARVGIGLLAEAVFLAYVFVVGRAAVRRGHTGDLDAALLEDRLATQA